MSFVSQNHYLSGKNSVRVHATSPARGTLTASFVEISESNLNFEMEMQREIFI
jgi:hypothetical protein